MSTAVAAREDRVNLSSPYKSLCVIVRSTVEQPGIGQNGQPTSVTVAQGKRIQFVNGFASVSREEFEEAAGLPSYEKLWWRRDSPDAVLPEGGPPVQVVNGALATATSTRTQQPIDGWDSLTSKAAVEHVEAGRVNLDRALAWERAHRRRKQVLTAIALKMAETGVDDPDDADPQPAAAEPPEAAFTVPADQGGL